MAAVPQAVPPAKGTGNRGGHWGSEIPVREGYDQGGYPLDIVEDILDLPDL